jgi:hypothetical protein
MSNLSGTWHSEHGSELHLEVDPDGRITGRFQTGVGFGKDQSFEVIGRAQDELVAITVSFGAHGAITSWVGHLIDAEARIEALWHMTVALPHPGRPDELWKGVWSGSDVFRRGRAETAPRKSGRPAPMPLWIG